MEVDSDIIFNFLCDLKKRDIDKIKRAKLVRSFLQETGWSERRLSRELGFEDEKRIYKWLLYEKIDRKQYDELIKEGYHDTEIFDTLNKKAEGHYADMVRSGQTDLDKEIARCVFRIDKILKKPYKTSPATKPLCKEMKELMIRIEARL